MIPTEATETSDTGRGRLQLAAIASMIGKVSGNRCAGLHNKSAFVNGGSRLEMAINGGHFDLLFPSIANN
eukprot:scaffold6008_cov23-Cyclotella_meneghiniana.AAC.1